MIEVATQNRRRSRIRRSIAMGVIVVATLGGAFAYKTLFARPGESALQYVPSDALLAVSIDLNPSPTQSLAFKHIDDALSRNGLDRFAENSFLDMVEKTPLNKELTPLVKRGVAGCLEQKPGKNGPEYTGMIFISLTDGSQAQEIIQKYAQVQFYKGAKYYVAPKSHASMMVVDDFLVLAESPGELLKVKEIREGTLKSITTVPEFVAARDQVASDANVLVFASPKLLTDVAKGKVGTTPNWVALGIAVRDGGIGLSVASKTDFNQYPDMKAYAALPPVRKDLFQVLPEGAYGVFALSDPSAIFDAASKTLVTGKDQHKALQDAEDSTEKSIGLSVRKDLIPGLQGDVVAALYPSQLAEPVGLDVLAIIDDQNGGDPATAVEKFQAFLNQQTAKGGNAPSLFNKKVLGAVTEYRINDKAEADMRKGIGNGMDPDQFNKSSLVGNKTVVFALIGKTVIAATSQDLLDRAVASYSSKTNGLAGDALFAASEKSVLDGSQSFVDLSVSRIAQGIKNTIHSSKMSPEGAKMFETVMEALESLKEPLTIKGKTSEDGLSSGGVFIPMDYDKLIDIIGGQMKKK